MKRIDTPEPPWTRRLRIGEKTKLLSSRLFSGFNLGDVVDVTLRQGSIIVRKVEMPSAFQWSDNIHPSHLGAE